MIMDMFSFLLVLQFLLLERQYITSISYVFSLTEQVTLKPTAYDSHHFH